MDPIRNPYAPGAGQRPPELAGRDEQLSAFDVVLARVAAGRPERSLVLTGLRGVGKTVLLNALRSAAVRRQWGTGKLEARPDQSLRRPLSSALHQAVRELGHRDEESVSHVLGVVRSFAQREAGPNAKLREQWNPGIDAPAVKGRADSGDIEIDLVELFTDLGGLAADEGKGIAVFVDEMQDLGPDDVSALCAACHEISQSGPADDRGRRRPAAPPGRAQRQQVLLRAALPLPAHRPAARARPPTARSPPPRPTRTPRTTRRRPRGDVRRDRRLPLLHPGLRQGGLGPRDRVADHRGRRRGGHARGRRRAGGRLLRLPLRAGDAGGAGLPAGDGRGRRRRRAPTDEVESVPTADVAAVLDKKPQSLSPARDALLKKGLIYASERGRIAFTVPHFGRYLREHA